MSINPFDDPSAGFPADDVQSLQQALASTEFRVQHSEPVVRDLNRHLVDLIGQCPNTACGNWVTLQDDGRTVFHIDLADALRLSTAFQKIAEKLELASVRRLLSSRGSTVAYLQRAFHDFWSAKTEAESVHIVARKGRGLFRKGR